MTKNTLYLIGDIGGTKARLALYHILKGQIQNLRVYPTEGFRNFEDLLESFLSEVYPERPKSALLAVAGPVIKGEATLTNLNWSIKGNRLKKRYSFEEVIIVNDLYSLAASIPLCKKEEVLVIKEVRKIRSFPKAFMAVGTGLGIALALSYRPLKILPSEGGHSPFPAFDEERDFQSFLKIKGRDLVWEEVLSGRGLSFLYEYYTGKVVKAEQIAELSKKGDIMAKKVIRKFVEFLGRKVYEIGVNFQPFGGIYLSGGVILGLSYVFEDKKYREVLFKSFYYSQRLKVLLDRIPLFLIKDPYAVLKGAQTILRSQLK